MGLSTSRLGQCTPRPEKSANSSTHIHENVGQAPYLGGRQIDVEVIIEHGGILARSVGLHSLPVGHNLALPLVFDPEKHHLNPIAHRLLPRS